MSNSAHPSWSNSDALSALMWLHDSGLDALVDDTPRNWLDTAAIGTPFLPQPASAQVSDAVRPGSTPALPGETSPSHRQPAVRKQRAIAAQAQAMAAAAAAAAAAGDVVALQAAVMAYDGCALSKTARNVVFAEGNFAAKALLLGEAPGEEEDMAGHPFAGPSGLLLDRMLAAIEMNRNDVLIGNVCFWRPPANRPPNEEELAHCLPFVHRLIALTQPRAILCLGATPARALLGISEGITSIRGQWHDMTCEGATHALLPTFHPAYLLRQPVQKRLAWNDLLSFSQKLKSNA